MMTPPRQFTVFARDWCSLCDEMVAALRPWCNEHGFDLDIVFIDGDQGLEQRYGTRVPVLTEGDIEICQYFLDADTLRAHLAARP